QLQDLHIYVPFFHQLFEGNLFDQFASELLGEPVKGKNLQYFNKPPRIGKPTPPHQDNYYFKLDPPSAVTMWLALEDIGEENGCVRYQRGSHLKGMRPHHRTNILGFSQGISDYQTIEYGQEVIAPLKAGDLLVHHSMTIHRADPNRSRHRSRRALGFVYYGVSAVEDPVARQAYRESLANKG
ncbi:MAG: phytanoyl-CoA dioxygenase family protein, partial [Saprospiraceae bacterium]|nr:phytanoyl-CoA dioxygenase family protein [Saprospiraceae bacterium]